MYHVKTLKNTVISTIVRVYHVKKTFPVLAGNQGGDYMAVTVDDIKLSLRIDVTEDDSMIQSYLDAAKDYVQTAVSKNEDLTVYKQYDFAVSLLTQFWYQNRVTDMKQTPYQVVSMIQQLRGLIS